MKIRKILFPTDFSDSSRKAAEYAAGLARAQGAEVVLLHVIEPYVLPIEYGLAPMPRVELDREAQENSRIELENWARKYFGKGRASAHVGMGRAAEWIVETARKHRCDLIVLGTHGRRGFSRLFLGSTAERVVRLSPCPVLTVPAGR